MAMGQREGVAVGAREPRATESILGPRALVSSHGQRCRHNLAHDSLHDPARDPARDPAKGGWAVWQWPCGSGRVVVAVWPWPCGRGRVVVTVWPWPCGRGRVAVAV